MDKIRILAIDDNQATCEQISDLLDGKTIAGCLVNVDTKNNFNDGLAQLLDRDYDIVILDIYEGDVHEDREENKRGKAILDEIKRAVPIAVILHTALAPQVEELRSDIVRIVPKGGEGSAMRSEVESLIASGLALIKQKLKAHLQKELTEYFWTFADRHPQLLAAVGDDHLFEHLIARRIALTLDETGAAEIFGDSIEDGKVHPLRMYIFPPIDGRRLMGDILLRDNSYWVILTPSCDLAHEGKAKFVLLAPASKLLDHEDYTKYVATPNRDNTNNLKRLISSSRGDKSYFLPRIEIISMPDLLLDLQQTTSVPIEELQNYTRVATIDAPYSQDLQARFARLFNRPGSPDIDIDHVMNSLSSHE